MGIIKGKFKPNSILKHVTLDGVRLHLHTVERKLWINGFYVLRLNESASTILEALIDSCYETPKENVMRLTIKKLSRHYKEIRPDIVRQDVEQLVGIINSFARNEIPTNLVGITKITREQRTAPNRMDIAITYECNNQCAHCYLPKNENLNGTLSTNEWHSVIDKLWDIGIPQLVFTGGECLKIPATLVNLIGYAKRFITGVITNGTLITKDTALRFVDEELDWIQITLDSHNEKTHDKMQGRKGAYKETIEGIKNCIDAGIETNVNMTLTKQNYKDLPKLIDLAKRLGVSMVSTNALINSGRGKQAKEKEGIPEKQLNKILGEAKKHAENKGIGFNWYLPTCYKHFNPVEAGFGPRCCSACTINMLIEPDGTVIPCQSWTHEKLGNILTDDWKEIWNHPLANKIRKHTFATKECVECKYLSACCGSCPLEKVNKGCKPR